MQRADRARSADWLPIIASGLFVVACAAAYGGLFSHAYPGDVGTYAGYGRQLVLDGRIPYHDFFVEYPPGSIPVFALPALIWNAHYVLVFKLLMTGCGVGFVICAAWIVRRLELSLLRLVPIILAPVLMGPVFLNRYDPVPALITSLALVAVLSAHERSAGGLLGAGTAIKLYPAIFVPLAARRMRSLAGAGKAYVGAAAVLILPFLLIAPGGIRYSIHTQLVRRLQIESLGSSILLAGSKLGIHHEGWINGRPGSIDLGGSAAHAVGIASAVVALGLVLVVIWAFWGGPDDDARQVTAWAAAVTAYVAFGKVLSPQYLTWLVPLVPLAAGRKGRYAAIVFLGVLSLTQFEYLFHKHGLQNQDGTVWVLLVRNAGLVAVFALLLAQLLEGRRQQPVGADPPTR